MNRKSLATVLIVAAGALAAISLLPVIRSMWVFARHGVHHGSIKFVVVSYSLAERLLHLSPAVFLVVGIGIAPSLCRRKVTLACALLVLLYLVIPHVVGLWFRSMNPAPS